jgi:hypothetical protein
MAGRVEVNANPAGMREYVMMKSDHLSKGCVQQRHGIHAPSPTGYPG